MSENIRVRFAPSPTGPLHIGGLRTALYNYLFAKKHQGQFILRIEDTDQNRLVPGAEDYIVQSLEWLGITPDESPGLGGSHAPYRQSDRAHIYGKYAGQLINEGKAYYAFDTPQELDDMRIKLKAAKVANQQYNSITRATMKNSLTLPPTEVEDLIAGGVPYVIRLKIPPKEEIRFTDEIRGWVKVHSSSLDDKVIIKAGGLPTYHLANVVDDHLMGITHVIRGEEWLPSAPLHVLLYRFLNWEQEMPLFAHLPLILKPDGKGKLSKREADRQGFPIFPLNWTDPLSGETSKGFREHGYLPEALMNFLALLGWNPGNEQEVFNVNELTEAFSLDRIVKSGAKFDINKAQWFNQHYLRGKSSSELLGYLMADLEQEGVDAGHQMLNQTVALLRDRITFPGDLWKEGKILFLPPQEYDQQVVQKKWNPEAAQFLASFNKALHTLDPFNNESIHGLLEEHLKSADWGFGMIMPVLRLALTGTAKGPDLMKVMEILGKEETVNRIKHAINELSNIKA